MANSPQLPTNPADKDRPEDPSIRPVVWAFLIAVIVVVLLGILLISRAGKRIFPMDTHSTPSQTRLQLPGRTTQA